MIKKHSTLLALAALAMVPVVPAVAATPAPTGFQAAAVKVDITPKDLTNLNPFGGGSFLAVRDPIFARVLLLSSGGKQALIVTFDTPEVGDMAPFRQRIEREAGIKFDHIFLAATHNHSAPRIGGLSKGTRAQVPTAESMQYSETVYGTVLDAIKTAKSKLQPAQLGYGKGRLDINVNRDVYTPGKGWGLGHNAEGVSDDGLPVIRIDASDGKPIALLFTYGIHSTASFGIKHITGDIAGVAERHVEEFGSEGVVGMFLMGPAGEQVPIVTLGRPNGDSPKYRDLAFRAMEAQGLLLGAAAVRIAEGITADQAQVRIAAANRDTVCPTKVTPSQMATVSAVQSPDVTVKLSALLLNDIALGGVGGEVVTPIYQRLMKQTPLAKTIFATNVNDRIGYIANDAAYDTPMFEVNGSPAARGCAEAAIADGLSDMFQKLMKP